MSARRVLPKSAAELVAGVLDAFEAAVAAPIDQVAAKRGVLRMKLHELRLAGLRKEIVGGPVHVWDAFLVMAQEYLGCHPREIADDTREAAAALCRLIRRWRDTPLVLTTQQPIEGGVR